MALGALHEVAGGGNDAVDGAAAALFAAGIAARTRGRMLWCVAHQDLFAPALAQAGLVPDRVIYVEAGDDKAVLACFEEALRHSKLGAVVAEVSRLSMIASRRLQLAAEGSGVIGLALRPWRRQAEAAEFRQPTAATTRWRVSALPSTHCQCLESAVLDGVSNWFGVAAGSPRLSGWKHLAQGSSRSAARVADKSSHAGTHRLLGPFGR